MPKDRDRYYREQLSRHKQASKEPVSQYIVSKQLLCLEVNPPMTEEELMLHIFEDMLPAIKKELYIKEFSNLNELKDNAERVESALKIMPNQGFAHERNAEGDKSIKALIEGLNLLLNKVEENTVQLNNLSKNRSDRMQYRFPPKYTNHIKPNFSTNFNHRINPNFNISHKFYNSRYAPNANSNPKSNSMLKSNSNYHQNYRETPGFYANNYAHNLQNNMSSENRNQNELDTTGYKRFLGQNSSNASK